MCISTFRLAEACTVHWQQNSSEAHEAEWMGIIMAEDFLHRWVRMKDSLQAHLNGFLKAKDLLHSETGWVG